MSSQPNDEGLPAAAVQILIDVFQRKNVGYNVKAVAIILVCGTCTGKSRRRLSKVVITGKMS